MSEARCVWPVGATLGEGSLWSPRDGAVYFVDIKSPAVHRLSLASGERRSWAMPEPIGWLIERRERPGFIAGFKSGFAELTLDPLTIRPMGPLEPELPGNRMNDGAADPWGRIWAGTMDNAEQAAAGALYRLDPDLTCRRMDQGYRVTNGPAFSPDGAVLYHTDSALRVVYRFDLGPDGGLRNKAEFLRFEEAWGYPDGMTCDSDGGVWIAHWGGSRVSRFTPDGRMDRSIALPASQVTSCVFAGDALDRMFVTTACIGLQDEPMAGDLFEIDPGARGLQCGMFGG
jgi:sugar lactone lactonase YvrE